MKRSRKTLFYLVSIMLVLGYLFYQDNSKQYILILRQKMEGVPLFSYLVQTEQCLSETLMQNDYLSNSRECQCDVIVYSYKEECLKNQHKHITYVYEPNVTSTWNTGRNQLYKIARERKESYLYYIFLDGDINLEYNKKFTPESMMSISPMRSFEQFLINRNPGIGVTDYTPHHGRQFIIEKIQQNCNQNANTKESNRTAIDSLYLTSAHFDALFNAFHRDIVDHLLPYIIDYDDQNWFLSQVYLINAVELKFRGQAILFTPVIVHNTEHNEYPHNESMPLQIWVKLVEEIVSTMPGRYQDNEWVKKYMEDPVKYSANSQTMCFILPIQYSFKMYSQFELNWSV